MISLAVLTELGLVMDRNMDRRQTAIRPGIYRANIALHCTVVIWNRDVNKLVKKEEKLAAARIWTGRTGRMKSPETSVLRAWVDIFKPVSQNIKLAYYWNNWTTILTTFFTVIKSTKYSSYIVRLKVELWLGSSHLLLAGSYMVWQRYGLCWVPASRPVSSVTGSVGGQYVSNVYFVNPKKRDFTFFELLLIRFIEHRRWLMMKVWLSLFAAVHILHRDCLTCRYYYCYYYY